MVSWTLRLIMGHINIVYDLIRNIFACDSNTINGITYQRTINLQVDKKETR
jgi:hypothetical protein